MSNNQIPLPSSRADMEKRLPRGKTIQTIETRGDKRYVTKGEMNDVFDTAKLPEGEVNQLQRHLTLGLALLQRAREHALLARVQTENVDMMRKLNVCMDAIEAIEKEWPVKIV